jgi:hypothetical protein
MGSILGDQLGMWVWASQIGMGTGALLCVQWGIGKCLWISNRTNFVTRK